MKKIMLAILLMTPVCAIAADKCIKLNPLGTDGCSPVRADGYSADGEMICPGTNGIPVRIIGTCAKTTGTFSDREVTVVDDLEVSSEVSENWSCWCKMVSPAVSRWVYMPGGNADVCAAWCAGTCAFQLQYTGAEFVLARQGLFSDLKD